jgi:hypothetical protein
MNVWRCGEIERFRDIAISTRVTPTRDVTVEVPLPFKHPKLEDRRSAADAAKNAMLEKFRAALQDPVREEQRAKRLGIHNARLVRVAERKAAKKATDVKLAAQAARESELANQAAREAEEANNRVTPKRCAAAVTEEYQRCR